MPAVPATIRPRCSCAVWIARRGSSLCEIPSSEIQARSAVSAKEIVCNDRSIEKPSRTSRTALPPSSSRASMTTTSAPSALSARAARRPASPAPTTPTRRPERREPAGAARWDRGARVAKSYLWFWGAQLSSDRFRRPQRAAEYRCGLPRGTRPRDGVSGNTRTARLARAWRARACPSRPLGRM